jgi:hypothetical protein
MDIRFQRSSEEISKQLRGNPLLSRYVDFSLPIPDEFMGDGEIKLIFLGQDPTVKSEKARKDIHTVLNLDKNGQLLYYLQGICRGLGLALGKNVYATNLFKNFFIQPPTQIREIDIFTEFTPYWLPLLRDELAQFPDAPVVTLGEPLLNSITKKAVKVRDFWGYVPTWKSGETGAFHYLRPEDTLLDRMVFPFPHQPSIRKVFYRDRLERYVAFMRGRLEAEG